MARQRRTMSLTEFDDKIRRQEEELELLRQQRNSIAEKENIRIGKLVHTIFNGYLPVKVDDQRKMFSEMLALYLEKQRSSDVDNSVDNVDSGMQDDTASNDISHDTSVNENSLDSNSINHANREEVL